MERNVRRQDGAAATEFALIAPILILLFFGIVYFGLHIYRQQVTESATREAARIMAVGGSVDLIEDTLDGAGSGFTDAELNITGFERDGVPVPGLSGGDRPCTGADTATVTTNASGSRLDFTVPFFGSVTGSYNATATFRCERND